MFGFLRRLRSHKPVEAPRRAEPAPESTPPSTSPEAAREDDEPPVRSWYSSSLDLHDGLEITDTTEETTEPMPLEEARRRSR